MILNEFEFCFGVITDHDCRTILFNKHLTTVHSLVSSLRKCPTYWEMKNEINAEMAFLQDYRPDIIKTRSAHFITERAPAQDALAAEAEEDEEDEEAVITIDLTGVP